jgi:hypothetical protein
LRPSSCSIGLVVCRKDEQMQMYRRIPDWSVMPVLLVVTLILLALGACGGASGQEEAKGHPLPKEPGTLSPGQYHSVKFKPSLSFKVGRGWATDSPEASDFLLLGWGEGGMGFVNVQKVYEPTETDTPKLVEVPKDLAGWLQTHPYIETTKPEPITVGGVKGEQFDATAEGVPEDHYSLCGTNCVDMIQTSTENLALFEGETVHSIVLEDVEGETVYIDYGTDPAELDKLAIEAQKVLESVKWAGS